MYFRRFSVVVAAALVACSGSNDASPPGSGASGDGGSGDGGSSSGDGSSVDGGGRSDGSSPADGAPTGTSPVIAGCPILPSNHLFNTPIDALPVHPSSAAFLATIGKRNLHLDLGQTVDPTSASYYGIPYNVVHASSGTWTGVHYKSADASLDWDPLPESDCANGSAHTLVSPCIFADAPEPMFPIPQTPLVEGGIDTDPSQPYGDHHILMLDADSCRLWELYHAYPDSSGLGWDIFGSASFDLRSNALRPAGWSSADAAGFPILPLLLRADEATSGEIKHALRFTIDSSKIRKEYTWPARHLTGNGTTSGELPPMGQLFRLKAGYAIPATFSAQSRAILQAMKTYGMYLADGGSNMFVSGEPNASWSDAVFSEVQSVSSADFEAVDLSPIQKRAGFDASSGAVPP